MEPIEPLLIDGPSDPPVSPPRQIDLPYQVGLALWSLLRFGLKFGLAAIGVIVLLSLFLGEDDDAAVWQTRTPVVTPALPLIPYRPPSPVLPVVPADNWAADRDYRAGTWEYIHAKKSLYQGDVIVLNTDKPCNFFVMTPENFRRYKSGESFQYYGDFVGRGRSSVTVPHGDTWHIVLDLEGRSGTISHSLTVLSKWP